MKYQMSFCFYRIIQIPLIHLPKLNISIPAVGTQRAVSVQVKVYDILGNEIETLVNEEKSPGTYEVTWNAAGLPSGVYFYQLRTGSFIDTKKMILLR